jgi:hypothetical protein
MSKEVAEVLGYRTENGVPVRDVRFTDGSTGTQTASITVESTITRADGSQEPGGKILNVQGELTA